MARRRLSVEKVTVSLPGDLLRYADQRAARMGTSRSEVITQAVAERRARDEEEAAREGYRFYATESEEFAAASLAPVSEAIADAG
jgi:metal-responsive CopG/Arc/MetJ family transcriptional regulator